MIKESLQAAGIKSIVWIDDQFATPSREDLIQKILKAAVLMKDKGLEAIAAIPSVSLTISKTALTVEIEEVLQGTSNAELFALSENIWETLATPNQEEAPQDDLSPDEFMRLKAAFGKALTTWSLADWTSKGAEACSTYNADTLFLVDKEFKKESPTFDGGEIVATVAKESRAFCILLTHRCATREDELLTRQEISTSRHVQFHKFAVLSKRPGEADDDINRRFARAFSTVMTQRFTGDIAFKLASTIKASADSTAERLSQVSVSDIDRAVFINSAREGVPEFDVLVRVFRVRQGKALNEALRTPELQQELRTIRSFAKRTRNFNVHATEKTPMQDFREWRKDEIFEDGAGLNAVHAPLVCGDIFEVCAEPVERYVLIGQACDLMMRRKGARRASLGFLLALEEIEPQKDNAPATAAMSPYRRFELGRIFGEDATWHVDFQNRIVADLDVLDLAVFNIDGVVTFTKDMEQPNIALPEGWERRLKQTKARFFPEKKRIINIPLSVGRRAEKLKGKISKGALTYPFKRIGRLDGNTATAVLAAWATFETRAALQHDFAAPEAESVSESIAGTPNPSPESTAAQ